MKKYIKLTYLITVVLAITLILILSFILFSHINLKSVRQNIKSNLITAKVCKIDPNTDYQILADELASNNVDIRVTIILKDGTVIGENKANIDSMPTHEKRKEFVEAVAKGYGEEIRVSETTGINTFYAAIEINDNIILRLSLPINSTNNILAQILPIVIFVCIILLFTINIFANLFSKKLLKPLERLNLSLTDLYENGKISVYENNEFDELTPVLKSISNIAEKLLHNADEIKIKKAEIDNILSSAYDGIILLSEFGKIISINDAAKKIFSIKDNITQFDSLCKYLKLRNAVKNAFQYGEQSNVEIDISNTNFRDKIYRCFINPAKEDNKIIGIIIFISDVTELIKLENMRTDFISNVSHELKSPLTSIKGFSELIATGIVNDKNIINDYLNRIISESNRLLNVINDILYLSETEKNKVKTENFEKIDLYKLCCEVKIILGTQANGKNVIVKVEGKGIIRCEYEPIREILLNLIDNAIKYNKEYGHVFVTIYQEEDFHPILIIKDDGIGIDEEHQNRIFERFYRVDKARSRKSGSTGLGLSIVKHSAQKYGIDIRLKSQLSIGTEITLLF